MDVVQKPLETPSQNREVILDTWRHFCEDATLQQAEPDELSQTLVQCLGREPPGRPVHLPVGMNSPPRHVEHAKRPLAADNVLDHAGDRRWRWRQSFWRPLPPASACR